MNLALTSDLPSTATSEVFDRMRSGNAYPRIAWIPPFTRMGRDRFPAAQRLFASHGFPDLHYCDIDEKPDGPLLTRLDQFDVIYLTGGDPIGFRQNIIRAGLSHPLRQCLAAGRLIVAASGGSMQLTPNVSLFRLGKEPLDAVIATRGDYEGLGIVGYEVLPHLDRHEPPFLEAVRRYSEHIAHDVIALADGAAVLHGGDEYYECVGRVVRYRQGVAMEIQPAGGPRGLA